jgi:Peptidase A4 family
MLSRRFLAAGFGAATLIGAVGLAVLPGAASARLAASEQTTVHQVAAANIPSPGGPMVHAATSGHASAQAAGQSFSVAEQSFNWSGFAVTSSSKFTYAQSRFVQPALTCPGDHANEWSSNWVGFDGFNTNSPTVEQDGTAAHCGGPNNTTPVYKAWYEMYPKGSVNVFSVSAGDTINTSVSFSNGKFTLTVADLTPGHKHSSTHTATCAVCKRNSAEWIIERPELCTSATNCFLTHLADFGTTSMSAKVRVAGVSKAQGIPNFRNYNITMISSPNDATPTPLDQIGKVSNNAFPATWLAEGPTVPIG